MLRVTCYFEPSILFCDLWGRHVVAGDSQVQWLVGIRRVDRLALLTLITGLSVTTQHDDVDTVLRLILQQKVLRIAGTAKTHVKAIEGSATAGLALHKWV